MNREDFYSRLWVDFSGLGLLGIHEGTVLSEEAAHSGLETESWVLDSSLAPAGRDWVGGQPCQEVELYFSTQSGATEAFRCLSEKLDFSLKRTLVIEEQKAEDWDAQWKASFPGVRVKPFWNILPPWMQPSDLGEQIVIRLNPGAGFGTGTHETTQLCLQVLGELAGGTETPWRGHRVLDFGSGSGILSLAAASLGAHVDAVEIDPLAIDNARENAKLNRLESQIQFFSELQPVKLPPYDIVVANILKPVLLEFASDLVQRLSGQGSLILSGLIASDVEPVTQKYHKLLGGRNPQVHRQGEWCALCWISSYAV